VPRAGGHADVPRAGGRADVPRAGGRADVPRAGGRADVPRAGGHALSAARALGTATGAAVPGTRSAYYEPAAATATEAASPGQFVVTGRDAPDPFVLAVDGTDYLYTSQGNQTGNNIPVAAGPSLAALGPLGDAMPVLPAWAVPGFTWAPDVHRFGDHYVLYFTSIAAATDPADECIGIASGTSPLGPFTAEPQPFVCQLDQRGSIDPRTFTDVDGTTYLIWKSDDNADVNGTELTNVYSQPLSPDGLHLEGQPTRIFGPDEPWQGRIVEAPDLVWAQGTYWLFYSGAWFNQPDYAIGVARCAGPLGPCADSSSQPFLASNDQGAGPGEPFVFRDATGLWLLYTPWRSDVPSFTTPPRPVAMLRLGFGPLGPYVASPQTVTAPVPQPSPSPPKPPPLEPPILHLAVPADQVGGTEHAAPADRADPTTHHA
jgi:Glycosyl hydrolases family 43